MRRQSALNASSSSRGQPQAQLDEVRGATPRAAAASRRRRRPARAVARRGSDAARVAADVEVVLHAPLGGEPVVVPAHRVEDVPPAHALVARDDVGLRVAEDVADVQRARHRRRRRVDDEGLVAPPGAGPSGGCPAASHTLVPARLGGGGVEVLGQLTGIDGADGGALRRRH